MLLTRKLKARLSQTRRAQHEQWPLRKPSYSSEFRVLILRAPTRIWGKWTAWEWFNKMGVWGSSILRKHSATESLPASDACGRGNYIQRLQISPTPRWLAASVSSRRLPHPLIIRRISSHTFYLFQLLERDFILKTTARCSTLGRAKKIFSIPQCPEISGSSSLLSDEYGEPLTRG
jgi:hypothetical protein